MEILQCLESLGIIESKLTLEEFDKSKHMSFASVIMDMDKELTKSNAIYNPAVFDDEESLGKISYEKYIDLLLSNNWRLFLAIYDGVCIGYIHTSPGKYKRSVYIGSFIVTKTYAGKGYGKRMMTLFEKLVKHEYAIMILNVGINNRAAVKLYTNAGFHATHMMMSKKLK